MTFRVINKKEVKEILSITKCIELVEYAHKQHYLGNTVQPLRTAIFPKQAKGILATMPAYISGNNEAMGLKAVTVFPENHNLGLESHQGAIVLINPENGLLAAIIDAAEITALRTAAASAVATKYLARENSSSLSLIGAGVQAHSHLQALSDVREIGEVTVWNRTPRKAEEFSEMYDDKFSIQSEAKLKNAVKSDIVCTLTSSTSPLIEFGDLLPGTHVNAVGASQPNSRELGSSFATNAKWFTDVLESFENEAGVILVPLNSIEISKFPKVTEIGEVIINENSRRKSNEEITIYKSLGVGIQDMITAQYVLKQAENANIGNLVEFN